ncbi:hypothetical protein AQ619_12975 [Caulobacter henricii]|uniref:Uncharacterized protein n=1 Tax=Caulobacter henricii TaxID=69395 RepID=A0A0P0P174_9CAUL|nr:hypothetical protein AQ619_12975 [Caulobacter henricii]
MGGYRLALALGAALSVITTGTASARQSGYVFLQCDYTGDDVGNPPAQFRIGNGRWDQLTNGAWGYAGGADCGGDGTTSSGDTAQTRCTFAENEYRMVTRYYGRYPSVYTHTINRVTGRYYFSIRDADGVSPVDQTAQCRPIAEPKTAQRIF